VRAAAAGGGIVTATRMGEGGASPGGAGVLQCELAGIGWPPKIQAPCAGLPRQLSRGAGAGARDGRCGRAGLDGRGTPRVRGSGREGDCRSGARISGNQQSRLCLACLITGQHSSCSSPVRPSSYVRAKHPGVVRQLLRTCRSSRDVVRTRAGLLCEAARPPRTGCGIAAFAALTHKAGCERDNAGNWHNRTRLQQFGAVPKRSSRYASGSAFRTIASCGVQLRRCDGTSCKEGEEQGPKHRSEAGHKRKASHAVSRCCEGCRRTRDRQNSPLRFCRGKTSPLGFAMAKPTPEPLPLYLPAQSAIFLSHQPQRFVCK